MALWHFLIKNTHTPSDVVGRALDAAVGALIFLSSILSVLKKSKKSVMSALCYEPIDASRGGIARWKGWERDG